MCIVSDKLKLCSCNTDEVARLPNYWVLKRPTDLECFIVGEILLPANIGAEADAANQNTILRQLNEGNCFDVDLQHQEGDILELNFACKLDRTKYFMPPCFGDFLAYEFQYRNGRWESVPYRPEWVGFSEVQNGKIVSTDVRSSSNPEDDS